MILLGAIVNGLGASLGGVAGALLGKTIPKRIHETLMKVLGLAVIYIGIRGALEGQNLIITILSLALGTLIGELIDFDKHLNKLGDFLQRKLRPKDSETSISEGFVSATLLICVGAMSIVGSLESGLSKGHDTLFAKTIIDTLAVMVLGSTLGIGVALSGPFVFLYQGAITLAAQFVAPLLTNVMIAEMNCVGSILIIGIGLNMLDVTKIRIVNAVPAIFLPILFCLFL